MDTDYNFGPRCKEADLIPAQSINYTSLDTVPQHFSLDGKSTDEQISDTETTSTQRLFLRTMNANPTLHSELLMDRHIHPAIDTPTSPQNIKYIEEVLGRPSLNAESGPQLNLARRAWKCRNESGLFQAVLAKLLPLDDIWDSNEMAIQANQAWGRSVHLPPSMTTPLPVPQPDQAIGWNPIANT